MSPVPYKSPGNFGNVILEHFCRAAASHPEENRVAQWLYKKKTTSKWAHRFVCFYVSVGGIYQFLA